MANDVEKIEEGKKAFTAYVGKHVYEGQVDPFGVVRQARPSKAFSEASLEADAFIIKHGLEVDKETARTVIVEAEKIDLDKLVQSYKEECGIEAALRLIKLGRASPEDFADDGKHGVDATAIPTFAGDALKALEPGIEAGDKLKQELGIPSSVKITEDNLEEIVGLYVKKKFEELEAAKAAATPEGETK